MPQSPPTSKPSQSETMSTSDIGDPSFGPYIPSKARASRDATLGYIQAAQSLLLKAAGTACDLQGWADQWQAIGDQADAVKDLWHKCNDAPLPTGHDYENTEP